MGSSGLTSSEDLAPRAGREGEGPHHQMLACPRGSWGARLLHATISQSGKFHLHCRRVQGRDQPGNRTPRFQPLPLTGCGPGQGSVSVSEPQSLGEADVAKFRLASSCVLGAGPQEAGGGCRWAEHVSGTAPYSYAQARGSVAVCVVSARWSLRAGALRAGGLSCAGQQTHRVKIAPTGLPPRP